MDVKREIRIPVYGLGCGGSGVSTIERELAATGGVLRVYVNPATETAYVDYDPAETDPSSLARAVERAGYRAGRPVEA
ncbi:MAG TPA: heavy metal-associated domain-containing protein [Candidatus Limnocylindrales bacterium]|nr:heavy metal-associated domain-containing protein [Candidatus Limnocylindrales bacterium]